MMMPEALMRKRLQPGGFVPRLSDGMHAIGGYSTSSGVPSELRSVCWVLRNSAGVVPIVEHYARTAHLFQGEASLPTRDFERLYTGLPQQDIVDRLSTLLQNIWQLHPDHPFLLVTSEGSQWIDAAHLPTEAEGGVAHIFGGIGGSTTCLLPSARSVCCPYLLRSLISVLEIVFFARQRASPWVSTHMCILLTSICSLMSLSLFAVLCMFMPLVPLVLSPGWRLSEFCELSLTFFVMSMTWELMRNKSYYA